MNRQGPLDVTGQQPSNGDVLITRGSKVLRPKRLRSNLFQFREGSGADRCVLDCINALNNGADLLWIETEKPHVEQIASMMDRIREVIPNAKLVYNNSPSFNWTLNFRQQVFDAWEKEGKDISGFDRAKLMSEDYDDSDLAREADEKIRTFQRDAAKRAGIFHHLITLPTYHTAALSTDNLAKEYFGDQGCSATSPTFSARRSARASPESSTRTWQAPTWVTITRSISRAKRLSRPVAPTIP